MPVPSSMADLSTTAASNYPTGSDSPTSGDDYFRSIQAIIRSTNAKGADIASATTTDIGAATGEFVDVTGTTTITGLGTIAAGIVRTVRFTGALTLTHNATSLILPSSANITTANGDVAQFRSLGSGNWKCTNYIPQAGYPLKSGATFTGAINEAQGADIASAGTVNLTTATGNYVHITGTTTITAITLAQGAERTVVFDGALTLTNGASLLLPTGANITTVAGDTAVFRGEAAGVVRCVSYVRKDGTPIKSGGLGTSTNDNAAAGYVGEYIESVIAAGSAVSLTTNTPANITSISLTAGDWDVSASVSHTPAPTTSVTQIRSSISLTSATMDSTVGRAFGIISAANVPATSLYSISSTTLRFSLASTTTIYLVTNDVFTVSTMTAYGILSARRVR